MKRGVILYHSNIRNIYKKRWVDECLSSILKQTETDFTFYEVDYGGENYSVLENIEHHQKSNFWSSKMNSYADAMNFILDKAFLDSCDLVFNVNLDDNYHPERFAKQSKLIEEGYDLISSDFCYIEETGMDTDVITNKMIMSGLLSNISSELERGHNIIAHPSVCYSRKFWEYGNKYDTSKVPQEDLDLWRRSIRSELRFHIIPEILLNYRIHQNQSSNSAN